jgi:uncharacterized protein
MQDTHEAAIAASLKLARRDVAAVLALLAEGATVPFIARYRKERTGGLDEVEIRAIGEQNTALAELAKRRSAVIEAIRGQGLLTPELERAIRACEDRTSLEDLYIPYKRSRKTRAGEARARGLEPLAELILSQPRRGDPRQDARGYVDPTRDVGDVDTALAGARDVIAELVCERADVRATARRAVGRKAAVRSKAIKKTTAGVRTAFESYYDFSEPARSIATHRYLAIARGEAEGFLRVKLDLDDDWLVGEVARLVPVDTRSPYADQLREAVADGYKRLLKPGVVNDIRADLKRWSDDDAVEVFAKNLGALLLAPPFGQKPVIALDPGFRSGCKTVVLTETGDLVSHTVLYPHSGRGGEAEAKLTLDRLIQKHRPRAIAVGNGTAGRETEDFVRDVIAQLQPSSAPQPADAEPKPEVVSVNEAGASVYSASDVAREEFPDHDLTVRGAVSIGRRLQDPLAELVKLDPKAIGVGQYQHDVQQTLLTRKLGDVVESCVNQVGVELNSASASLLAHVSGIGPGIANKIVAWRAEHGKFLRRADLLKVPGLGPKTYEQAAGFLRIREGADPLDASAVHPERYALVAQMARDLGLKPEALVGSASVASQIDVARYVDAEVGEPTLRDIVAELSKPGRDPRENYEATAFRDDIRTLKDLYEGLVLNGVVTNVTAFGAFVDVGVHQDGLVHVSELADRFVRDPAEIVQPGQRLRVRVLSVDLERKRVALSAKELN